MTADEGQEESRSRSPLTQPVRFLLHWVIKAIVLVVQAVRSVLRPKPVRYGLLVLLVAGGIGWKTAGQSYQLQSLASAAPSGAIASAYASSLLPESPAVRQYLKSQAAFDAKGMWDALGSDMQQQLEASNGSMEALQAQLDSINQQGRRYTSATYVGGMTLQGGDTVYFYVLREDDPSTSTDVPYIYVIGPDGKIAGIQ